MGEFLITTPEGRKFRVQGDTAEGAAKAVAQMTQKPSVPDGYFLNPETGQMTSRELLSRNMDPSRVESAAIGSVAGATLGGDDELAAGVRGAMHPGEYTREEQSTYELERQRARKDAAWRDHPWATTAGVIGGAISGAYATRGLLARLGVGLPAATTMKGTVGQMIGAGTVGGATEGFLSGEGGWQNRRNKALIGGGVGMFAAPLAGWGVAKVVNVAESVGGKTLRRVFGSRKMFNPDTGELTDMGRKALRTLGYNADEITDRMQQELTKAANDATSGRIPPEAVDNVATFERFNVPYTKGQATGDVAQIGAEESFRAGTRGQGAYNTITEFDVRQASAVGAAREGVIPGTGGNTPTDIGDDVITSVRREADAARNAGRQAYDALEDMGAALRPESGPVVKRQIEVALQSQNIPVDAGTENARRAIDLIGNAFNSDTGSVPFTTIERTRQRLNGLKRAASRGSNGADQEAMSHIVDQFDAWLDDTITDALIAGSDDVLDQAKQARSLWSNYRQTFLSKEGADNFIRKIVEDDLSPDEVARWLYGASTKVGGGKTSLVAQRVKNILGDDSVEWTNIRRGAWDKITMDEAGNPFGPDKIVTNINNLLSGKGQALGRELYSADELAQMREFRNLMMRLQVPKKAGNPSGSAYTIERSVNQAVSRMSGIMFGLPGVAAGKALETGGNFSSTLASRAATKGVNINPPSPLIAGASVAPSASTYEDRRRGIINRNAYPPR